jgi:RimJ/RimL family protein N-acetyltransferase
VVFGRPESLRKKMLGECTFPERIDTERLILRRYSLADAAGILELVDKNRARLVQNFSQMAKGLLNAEDVESFIEEKSALWNVRRAFCYGLWPRHCQEPIGQLLVKNIVWDVPSAELSYFIDNSSQRHGFATEAVSAILRTGLTHLDFKRMFVRIIPSNKESILLANKLGFKHEGLHRNEFRCGFGELHDVHYFSLTLDDYNASRKIS